MFYLHGGCQLEAEGCSFYSENLVCSAFITWPGLERFPSQPHAGEKVEEWGDARLLREWSVLVLFHAVGLFSGDDDVVEELDAEEVKRLVEFFCGFDVGLGGFRYA